MSAKGFAKFIIVLTTVSAAVMELIDTSIVNVALSDMSGSLGVSIEDMSRVITSYAIANVIIIPLTGFLAEYFAGRITTCIDDHLLWHLICVHNQPVLSKSFSGVLFRVGGGALLSTSRPFYLMLLNKDRPIASGLFGMGIVLGPTLGPTLGGFIIEHMSWPMIFMINIPIGIIASILTITFIDKKPNEGKNKVSIKIDYTGIALLAAGIGCLQCT
jgi:DHA2 family multidrug resistance protein